MGDPKLQAQVLEACRGLAAYGLGPSIGGHVSIRVPGKDLYYSNAFDKTLEEMRIEDILLLDFNGNIVDSNRLISQGLTFHSAIYKHRPDVGAIVHTHGFWTTAQSAFGRPLRSLHNLSTYFYERTCVSPNDDFEAIGAAVRPQDVAIIMPWHGAITVGKSIVEASALHVLFDYAARLDVTLPPHTPEMPHQMCFEMRAVVERADLLKLTWDLICRKGRDSFDGQRVIPNLAA
jgi:ribulose-5-phosphate 4-epimerase/fuculose-1-phosphate aldolase